MKKLLGASGLGILLMALPAISSAGTGSFFYRSYDCTGANPSVTINTNNTTPPSNNSGNNNNNTSNTTLNNTDNNNTDNNNTDNNNGGNNNGDNGNNNNPENPTVTPIDQGNGDGGASVPAPAASEIAIPGLAIIAAYSWRRSRKLSQI